MRELRTLGTVALAACTIGLVAGCGGERQDADEPSGEFRLSVVEARFPTDQSLAQRSTLAITVRNDDSRTLPDVAMTVQTTPPRGRAPLAFAQAVGSVGGDGTGEAIADPGRPVWVLDGGPRGGDTAYADTWALGPLRPGQARTFRWNVTPVKAGRYTVTYTASPGLAGKARPAPGTKIAGALPVEISDAPAVARVNGD